MNYCIKPSIFPCYLPKIGRHLWMPPYVVFQFSLQYRGIVYIGDSVGAHFHVPPNWFTPSQLTTGILTNVSYVISNEFDWPDVGFATGFRNATQMPELIFDNNGNFSNKSYRYNLQK